MSFDVGERIREFRKQAGLNQDQLAELSSLNAAARCCNIGQAFFIVKNQ